MQIFNKQQTATKRQQNELTKCENNDKKYDKIYKKQINYPRNKKIKKEK